MKIIESIANWCKSVGGIITFTIAIITIGSRALMLHNANVIKTYVDSVQIKTDKRFNSLEGSVTSLTSSVNDYMQISNSNFVTVKSEFQNHIQKSKDIKPDDRLNDILRVVNGIKTDIDALKKN